MLARRSSTITSTKPASAPDPRLAVPSPPSDLRMWCTQTTARPSASLRSGWSSWLGLCPQFKKTGGKVQSSRTRPGKNRAALALRLAAWSLIRSKSYLGAYLRRQRSRMGAPKAITATAHKLARIIYNMMRFGVAYAKREESQYADEVKQKLEKSFHRRA